MVLVQYFLRVDPCLPSVLNPGLKFVLKQPPQLLLSHRFHAFLLSSFPHPFPGLGPIGMAFVSSSMLKSSFHSLGVDLKLNLKLKWGPRHGDAHVASDAFCFSIVLFVGL